MESASSSQAGLRPKRARIAFVDTLRGLAVLDMFMWHSLGGWLEPSLRGSPVWRGLRMAAGVGAPLFILLAGAAVALRLDSSGRRGVPTGRTVRALVSRGILIVFLGYALRLQSWLVDALAITRLSSAIVWVPAGVGLTAAVVGTVKLDRQGAAAGLRWLVPGALLFFGGLSLTAAIAPSHFHGVLRVDVLQCIGASLAVVAWLASATGAVHRPLLAAAVGLGIAFVTPLVSAVLPPSLPFWLTGYLADTRTTNAAFPLLPWCGYAWIGLSLGTLWLRASANGRLVRTIAVLGVTGVVLGLLTCESLPYGYRLVHAVPWLAQPVRVAYRTAVVLVLCGPALAIAKRALALRRFGQASLVVYWVHLTFAYGLASHPLHHRLGWVAWLGCLSVLTLGMYAVALFRLGPYQSWRSRMFGSPVAVGTSSS